MKSRVFKKFVSLLLVLVFSTQLVTPALAAVIQNDDGSLILTDENGNVIEEDWEAEFPYGTFVFENSQLGSRSAFHIAGTASDHPFSAL